MFISLINKVNKTKSDTIKWPCTLCHVLGLNNVKVQ